MYYAVGEKESSQSFLYSFWFSETGTEINTFKKIFNLKRNYTMINFNSTEAPIDIQDLISIESTLGYNLPDSYKHHMLKFNGGSPESKNCFKGMRIAHFNPIKYGNDTLQENIEDFKELLPEGFLPFTYDWGGNPVCIDLKNGTLWTWEM